MIRPLSEGAVFALLATLPWIAPDQVLLATQVAVLALYVVSLDLLVGHAGIVSLGHAAFFGIGAYAAALLALAGWEEPISGLLLSALAAGLAGLLLAPVVMRAQGLGQLMLTLGILLLLHEVAARWRGLTGGDDGLSGFLPSPLLGRFEFDLFGVTAYLYAITVLAFGFFLFGRIVESPFGVALQGLRQNSQRMAALGTDGRHRLGQGYAVAAALAGAAGALLAQTTQSVALEAIGFQRSAEALVVLVLGGAGRRYGGPLGALAYLVVRDWLAAISPQYWMGWIGVGMMLVVLLAPGGLMGALSHLAALRRRLSRLPAGTARDAAPESAS